MGAIPTVRFSAIERTSLLNRIGTPGTDPPGKDMAQLVLIHAPMGSGKTALISRWASWVARSCSVLWFSTAGVEEAEDLWHRIWCGILGELPSTAALSGDAWRDLHSLVQQLEQDTVIVIDDYEHLTSVEVDRQVSRLAAVSDRVHVVVLSRRFESLTAGPSTQLLARLDLGFDMADLAMLARHIGLDQADQIDAVYEAYSGWPLGSHVALLTLLGGDDLLGSGGHLYDLVLSQARSDEQRRAFAVIAREQTINLRLLAKIMEMPVSQAQAVADSLVELGVISLRGEDGQTDLQCLPGLAAVASDRLHETWDSESFLLMEQRKARWLAEQQPAEALRAMMARGSYEEADVLLSQHFSDVLRKPREIIEALRAAPLEDLDSYPLLLLVRVILERPDPSVPIDLVETMAARIRASLERVIDDRPAIYRVAILTLLVAVERILGHWENAHQESLEVEERLKDPSLGELWGEWIEFPIVFAVLSLTGALVGDMGLAARTAHMGYEVSTLQSNPSEQAHALGLRALAHALRSDTPKALADLERIAELSAKEEIRMVEFSWVDAEIATMMTAASYLDLDRGLAALQSVEPVADRTEQWPLFVLAESAILFLQKGALAALLNLRNRWLKRPASRSVAAPVKQMLDLRYADLAMAAGRVHDAEKTLDGVPRDLAIAAPSRVRLHLVKKDNHQALAAAGEALRDEDAWGADWREELLLLEAVAAARLGRGDHAVTSVSGVHSRVGDARFAMLASGVPYADILDIARRMGTGAATVIEDLPQTLRLHQYESLTTAELEVVRALGSGKTLLDIAADLHVSKNTLKSHLRTIYHKLQVPNRHAAVSTAHDLGILD